MIHTFTTTLTQKYQAYLLDRYEIFVDVAECQIHLKTLAELFLLQTRDTKE